ncbi:MAG: PEP-CTERM sorting domain-containing protein [Cyanophyceae cyanobacterium]
MNSLLKGALKGAAVVSMVAISVGTADVARAGKLVSKTIDFTGLYGKSVPNIFQDLGNGVSLDVTAGFHAEGANENAPFDDVYDAKVSKKYGYGLGVKNSPYDGSNELDGSGYQDILRFTFSQDVTLHKVFFSKADYFDQFDASIDEVDLHINNTFGTDYIVDFPEVGYTGIHRVNFKKGVDFAGDGTSKKFPAIGQIFDFYTANKHDDYRIAGLKVWVMVPEPGTVLGLLGVGAAMVGVARKNKRA